METSMPRMRRHDGTPSMVTAFLLTTVQIGMAMPEQIMTALRSQTSEVDACTIKVKPTVESCVMHRSSIPHMHTFR